MALGDPYATLADLRDWQGVAAGQHTADDAKRTAALAGASREIERYCGRQFNNTGGVVSARVYVPEDLRHCAIDDFYTTTGLIVQTDPGGQGNFSSTWNVATDFELKPLNGVVDGQPGWPYSALRACGGLYFPKYVGIPYRRTAVVQVTAAWGWLAVPDPIHEACLIMAAQTFKMKDAPFGIAGMTQYGTGISVRQNAVAQSKVNQYVRTPVLGA